MIECKICGEKFDSFKKLSSHLKKHKISSKEYYDKYISQEKTHFCKICGVVTTFRSISKGYSQYCSLKCSINEKTQCKRKKTNLERYGVENPFQLEKNREKYKKTCIRRYGVENPSQSDKVKEKTKQTNLERYGVKYPIQSEEVKDKIKKTMMVRYGEEHNSRTQQFKDKCKQTCLKNYGVENPLQSKEIREKIKQTCIKRYGAEYAIQNEVIYYKYIKTMLKRYGVTHPACNINIKNDIQETKRRKFFLNILTSNRLKERCIPNFTIDDYQGSCYRYSWTCTKCQTIFEDSLDDGHIPRCSSCYPKLPNTRSIQEKEVVHFIKFLGIDIIENDRTILNPKELDIYIPSHNLAIEFDGLYWHSEISGNKDKNYHLNKTLKCKEKGIQLIHIFEDEWIDKQEIVKSIITAKLGLIQNRIYARKCQIKEVPNKEAKLFLFDNHLQGPINGTHLGLYHNDDLVSMLTYGKSRFNKNYDYEILRFCNKINTSVVGGLSRLLKNANLKSVITYADLRYGTGKGYLNCGFQFSLMSSSSYYYLKDNQKFTRFQFQKHLLSEKLDIFDPTLTEWQNMQLNGYDRIWDCGTSIFVRA